MSKLIEIRRRIKSTKNIHQITKAMEMVSAVKLQKSQMILEKNKKYIENLEKSVKEVMSYKDFQDNINTNDSLIIIVSPSKGFVGPLVTNLEKKTREVIEKNKNKKFKIIGIGKKSLNFIFSLGCEVIDQFNLTENADIEELYILSDIILEDIFNNKLKEVYIIYNKFINILTNEIILEKIFPIDIEEKDFDKTHYIKQKESDPPSIYDLEMNFDDIYEKTLKLYIPSKIQSCIIESVTAENAIRMITMRNAADNAEDLNSSLVFQSNKIRQSSITQEVIEIASASNI